MIQTLLVTDNHTGSFEDVLNNMLYDLQRDNNEIIDIKFTSSYGGNDLFQALIIYKEGE